MTEHAPHGDSRTPVSKAAKVTRREIHDGFKQVGEHVEGCFADRYTDDTTFIVHEGMDYTRKRNGDRGGSTGWHVFRCNDLKCEARLLVRWDTLAHFINRRRAP